MENRFMADQNVDVSSMVTLRYLMLMLVFIANMHVHAQKKKDVIVIRNLLESNQCDSAKSLLQPYLQKFADSQEGWIMLSYCQYIDAVESFNKFQGYDGRDLLVSAEYIKAKNEVVNIGKKYENALAVLKGLELQNPRSTKLTLNSDFPGYYFRNEALRGYDVEKDFGLKKPTLDEYQSAVSVGVSDGTRYVDSSERLSLWDYESWSKRWVEATDHWLNVIPTRMNNYVYSIEKAGECGDIQFDGEIKDSFKRNHDTFFQLDDKSLLAHDSWLRCALVNYTKSKKGDAEDVQTQIRLAVYTDSLLETSLSLMDTVARVRYSESIAKAYDSWDEYAHDLGVLRTWLSNQIDSLRTEIQGERDKAAALEFGKARMWAFLDGKKVPIFPIDFDDYFTEELPDQLIPEGLRQKYKEYESLTVDDKGYCATADVRRYSMSGAENRDKVIIVSTCRNEDRFKRDYDVKVVLVDNDERDVRKKVIWSYTEALSGDGRNYDDIARKVVARRGGGCFVIYESNPDKDIGGRTLVMAIAVSSRGELIWRKEIARDQPRAGFGAILDAAVLIEDRKGDLVAYLKDQGILIKLDGNTGAESWRERIGISVYDDAAGLVEFGNGDLGLVLNVAAEGLASGGYNTALVVVRGKERSRDLYQYPSEEPRYLMKCRANPGGTIYCSGRRGYFNHMSTSWETRKRLYAEWADYMERAGMSRGYYIELDSNGNVVNTNGGQ
ncbi:MAG: hypothetical protein KDC02_08155 [Flavobacteriales bacterium]|nr:hypothetical protein [Flavobacteriales bacterium]